MWPPILFRSGQPLWTNRYVETGYRLAEASAVAVDGSGNSFVAGSLYDTNGNSDYVIAAYSSAGVPLWTNRYNGLGFGQNYAKAIVVNSSGNVVVTGSSSFTNGHPHYVYSDYVTLAYSNAGVPLWTNRWNELEDGWAYARAIAVDNSGNVL
jgi:hypothetical protein